MSTPAGGGATAPPGRVVLVTGGSRGIGLGCARRFQALGDRVAVTYRTAPPAELAGPRPDSVALLPVPCDVRDPAQVESAFAAVEQALGPVEVLVANAGITKDTLLLRMGEEAWNEVIDTNLSGVYRVVRRGVGPMVRAHRGRIVLVSSVVAFFGSPGQVNYRRGEGRPRRPGPVAGARGREPGHHGERCRARRGRHGYDRQPGRTARGPAPGVGAVGPQGEPRRCRGGGGLSRLRRRRLHHRSGASGRRWSGDGNVTCP